VIDGTVHRFGSLKRLWLLVSAALVLAAVVAFAASDSVRFVVCSVAQFFVYGMPQPKDVDEADEATKIITAAHHFAQNSVSQPDRPPVFSNAGSRMFLTQPTEIEMYGVRDRAEQDKVIGAVKDAVRDKKFKPVDLCFMDHENWIAGDNWGERGPELQLRLVRISENVVRELGGQKTITYPVP
jgi:hypothetical protein